MTTKMLINMHATLNMHGSKPLEDSIDGECHTMYVYHDPKTTQWTHIHFEVNTIEIMSDLTPLSVAIQIQPYCQIV